MPAACQALGMALHELATNASKYGALSGASGSIRLEWEITAGEEPLFKIRWSERGGPPPKQPERQGFGHKVIVKWPRMLWTRRCRLPTPAPASSGN